MHALLRTDNAFELCSETCFFFSFYKLARDLKILMNSLGGTKLPGLLLKLQITCNFLSPSLSLDKYKRPVVR